MGLNLNDPPVKERGERKTKGFRDERPAVLEKNRAGKKATEYRRWERGEREGSAGKLLPAHHLETGSIYRTRGVSCRPTNPSPAKRSSSPQGAVAGSRFGFILL